jgi:hypothetical protein
LWLFEPIFASLLRSIFIFLFVFASTISFAQVFPNFGGQRAGLSALSFLKNDLNPASFAQGGASVANTPSMFSSENNPAALGQLKHSGFALSNMVIGAGINQSLLAVNKRLNNGATLGFNVNTLNSGEMLVRTEFEPNGTGQTFYANNTAVGFSYGQKLTDKFSIGVGIKYVYEGIATYQNHTATADIGFLYMTDYKDLTFAVVVKNFGGNSQMQGSDLETNFNRTLVSLEKYTTPTIFKMGFSFIPYQTELMKLRVAAELNHPNDNAENIRLGGELNLRELLFVRLGYKLSVKGQNYPTFGLGYKTRIGSHPLYVDYGINPTNQMGVQHIFGISVPLNNDQR